MISIANLIAALNYVVAQSPTLPDCRTFAKGLQLAEYNATVVNATLYPVNTYNMSTTYNKVPFCEITTSTSYGDNDTLISTIWLPSRTEDFKSRFLAIGNGGMAGKIDYSTMFQQLNGGAGFAIAAGDAGHRAADNNGGVGAPNVTIPYLHDKDQTEAWIRNAISLFTPAAKGIIKAYYGQPPKYSYYAGCSTGGGQGFALAQFHPELFDGIYAGSPGNWYSHLALSFLWNALHTNTTPTMISNDELNFTTNAILDKCDLLDGAKDRLLENPLACKFDITSLDCSRGQTHVSYPSNASITCLPTSKINAIQSIYAGPKRSDNGTQVYPGFSFGSEVSWNPFQEGSLAKSFSIPILQNLVFNSISYDANTFNFASDVDLVNQKASSVLDSISPDLSAFYSHGGKMLTTQGWADPYNAAQWPIDHLNQLNTTGKGNVDEYYKLFMIPGGGHCGAAANYPHIPAQFYPAVVKALLAWVEGKQAPTSLVSTNPPDNSNATRLLCAWPQTAHIKSKTQPDLNHAEGYYCA